MNVEEWARKVKECKKSQRFSGDLFFKPKIARSAEDERNVTLIVEDDCSKCRHRSTSFVVLKFKVPHKFTVFEVGVLVAVFVRKQEPADYARFHKVPAGEEFVRNLESVEVLQTHRVSNDKFIYHGSGESE